MPPPKSEAPSAKSYRCSDVPWYEREAEMADLADQQARVALDDPNSGPDAGKRVQQTTVAAATAKVDLDVAKRDCHSQ